MAGMFSSEAKKEVIKGSPVNLTIEQQDAIDAPLPTVVLSCAGTGKTTTMIERIVKAAEVDNISLDNIFVTTFSRHAAQDMIKKLILRFGNVPSYIGTFHRNCLYAYRKFPQLLHCHNYKQQKLKMISASETDSILRNKLSEAEDYFNDNHIKIDDVIDECRDLISMCKSKGIYPIDYHMNPATKHESCPINLAQNLTIFNDNDFWKVYTYFQTSLKSANKLDFNDVISLATFALRDKKIKATVSSKFQLVVVDEL